MVTKEEKMAEIALRNVCKQFDSEHYGVKDFTLDIHDKEFVIFRRAFRMRKIYNLETNCRTGRYYGWGTLD